jgi:hypothetical protein
MMTQEGRLALLVMMGPLAASACWEKRKMTPTRSAKSTVKMDLFAIVD